jgi:hypothetical protein
VHILLKRSGIAAAAAANKGSGAINAAFPHNLLPYNGGPVMHTSHVYAIYWPPSGYNFGDPVSDANYESLINGFFTNLSGTQFYDILTQYPDTTGPLTHTNTFGGSYVDTTAYPCGSSCGSDNPGHYLSDTDIQNEVLRATHANGWLSGQTNQYMVFYGNGVHSCLSPGECSDNVFSAYHGQFTGNNGSTTGQWIYSNMYDAGTDPGCSLGQPSPNGDAVARPGDQSGFTRDERVDNRPRSARGDKSRSGLAERRPRPERLRGRDRRPLRVRLEGDHDSERPPIRHPVRMEQLRRGLRDG